MPIQGSVEAFARMSSNPSELLTIFVEMMLLVVIQLGTSESKRAVESTRVARNVLHVSQCVHRQCEVAPLHVQVLHSKCH